MPPPQQEINMVKEVQGAPISVQLTMGVGWGIARGGGVGLWLLSTKFVAVAPGTASIN